MKKGFTLIELIVVIAILAIIALISVPIVNNVITQSKERAYKEQEKTIIDSAKTYMTSHFSDLPKVSGGSVSICVRKLKGEGLLKNGDIKNPVGANYKTEFEFKERNNVFDGGVLVRYNGKKYSYAYINECEGEIVEGDQTVYAMNSNNITINTSTLQDIGTIYSNCTETGHNVCLQYTIKDNIVKKAQVCFMKDGSEYCMTGGDNGAAYDTNVNILRRVFPEENVCNNSSDLFECRLDSDDVIYYGYVTPTGNTGLLYNGPDGGMWECYIRYDKKSWCSREISG